MGSRLVTLCIRLLLIALLLAASATGGAWLLFRAQQNEYQAYLEGENARLRERSVILEHMVERMGRTRRLAQIVVTEQRRVYPPRMQSQLDPDNVDHKPTITYGFEGSRNALADITAPDRPDIETSLLIVELDDDESPIRKWSITIPGRVAFFDGLVVKFGFDSVAEGHPLRGRSIAILRRVYSESLPPQHGIPLDEPGSVPAGYRMQPQRAAEDHVLTDRIAFERKIWEQFWDIANDPVLAAEFGVRVAQGEAVYKPMMPGVLYELTIDAVGGLNLEVRPLPEAVSEVLAAMPTSDATQ